MERSHLVADLGHHLAGDLVDLVAELEDFVIDLLIDLVELVHEVIGVALVGDDVSVRLRVRKLVEHGLHLVDVLVRQDLIRACPLDRHGADSGALDELRVGELEHSDRVAGEFRIRLGGVEGDGGPAVGHAEDEDTLAVNRDVRVHVRADGRSLFGIVRDEGRDDLVLLVGNEGHWFAWDDLLCLQAVAERGLLGVDSEGRRRHCAQIRLDLFLEEKKRRDWRSQSPICVVAKMSSSDRARAKASLSRAGWRRYERSDITVETLEHAVKDHRWCAYGRNFYHISKFSMEQRPKLCGNRFSMHFSNDRQRAKMTPSTEIPDDVLRCHLERAKWIVVGVNDKERAPALSLRDLRAAGRTDQDVEEMIEEMEQADDEAGVDEHQAADEPDANGASGSGSNGASGSSRKARKEAQNKQSKARKRACMTAEQQQQSARDRAARDERLTKEALKEYTMDFLPNLVQHDENVHSDDLQRDQGNGALATWDEWTGPEAHWTTALDDGAPSDARKNAAAADLQIVNEELVALNEWQGDAVERNLKLKLITRVANKLAKIVAGTAGYSDLSRGDWRQQGCAPLIQDGSKYTCIQDSLVVAARYVGCVFNTKQLHDALDDPLKEAEIGSVMLYGRDTLGLAITCLTQGPQDGDNASLCNVKGGLAFATLQLNSGAYMIVLNAILQDDTVERHAVAFLADFQHPAYLNHYGALVDNDPRVSVRFLEPSDRASVSAARKVFDNLFWTAKKVMITSVWKVAMP